jgi:hypothetical protein
VRFARNIRWLMRVHQNPNPAPVPPGATRPRPHLRGSQHSSPGETMGAVIGINAALIMAMFFIEGNVGTL